MVNLTRGPVEGIQCTSSYVEKTSHTCSLNVRREFTGVTEGGIRTGVGNISSHGRSTRDRRFISFTRTRERRLSVVHVPTHMKVIIHKCTSPSNNKDQGISLLKRMSTDTYSENTTTEVVCII